MTKGRTMKRLFIILTIISFSSFAQDPAVYINNFDAKVYSLKTKGVQDFVVDIESSKLTRQINEQKIFGKIDQVTFRFFWTAKPERFALEIYGLPEGFREIKEELKMSILSQMDSILPLDTLKRFAGYKISAAGGKEFMATDSTGLAAIPSFRLKFDEQDKLIQIVGEKPFGSVVTAIEYSKDSFADGKWVIKAIQTMSKENGQTFSLKKQLSYGSTQGIGVVESVNIHTEQKLDESNAKPLIFEESLTFKNYKINSGDGLKHFLSEK
jgi:hypothetical protein